MAKNLLLDADDLANCPKCGASFPIGDAIAQNILEAHEGQYESYIKEQRSKLKAELTIEAERVTASKISELAEQVRKGEDALKEAEKLARKAVKEAESKATQCFEDEKRSLQEAIQSKDEAIKEFRKNELDLRKARQQLEEEKKGLDLDIQRKLDESRKEIEQKVANFEADKFKFKELEYEKKLNDAKIKTEELTSKLEQSSQQLQGEVFELEIERVLKGAFPQDDIEEIAKGERGADVLQVVKTSSGQTCGSIIWEAKKAKTWSKEWLSKLKEDQVTKNADIAVIVSTCFPKECKERINSFANIEGVWVSSEYVLRPVAEALRFILIQAHDLKVMNSGRNEKMEVAYNYLCSQVFSQRIRSIIEAFGSMQTDLNREKKSTYINWKKRETHLERVASNICSIVGELQAISHNSLEELSAIETEGLLATPLKIASDNQGLAD